jgi:hypothetical protein
MQITDADLDTQSTLVPYVDLRRGVVADQQGRETGRFGECGDLCGDLVP